MPLFEAPDRIQSGSVQLVDNGDGVFEVVDPNGTDAFSFIHYYEDATHNKRSAVDAFYTGADIVTSFDALHDSSGVGRTSVFESRAGSSSQWARFYSSLASGTGTFSMVSPVSFNSQINSGVNPDLRYEIYVANPVAVGFIGLDSAGKFCGGASTKWQFQSIALSGATSIGYEFDTISTLSTAGAKHTSWKNHTTEIMSLDKDGLLAVASANFAAPVDVDLSANSAGVATTFSRADHKHDLSEAIAPTWSGVHTFSLKDVHTSGLSLSTSGVTESAVANTASNTTFMFRDTVARTSIQNVYRFESTDTGTPAYMIQLNTGEFTVGYGTSGGTPLAPQTGHILGFIAGTSSHPSWASTILKNGLLAYIKHDETTITPTNISGSVNNAFVASTSSTIPSNTMAAFGSLASAGSAADSSSYSAKKLASFVAHFSGGTQSSSYLNATLDQASNNEAVYGNWALATQVFCNQRGYLFVKGGTANPTNKPASVTSLRVPIQGMGSTTQSGILGSNIIIARSAVSGHVNEDINNVTNSFFMSVPFPSATATGARGTIRATNAAHFAVEAFPAASGGPTWATWTNPEDTETNNYYGKYLDSGTNNAFGWYQHDGTSWQRQLGIVATGRFTGQTAAKATVASYTVAAADASFQISMNVLVTTSTLHNFTCECAYTDEGNTARVVTLNFNNLAGAFVNAITNAAGAVPYEGVPLNIRCKAATTITLRTQAAGVYTTVTYNVEGKITALT